MVSTKVNWQWAALRTGSIGVVHLGLGAFHRAHQAVYLERYRQRTGDPSWGVCAANLRSNIDLVDGLRQVGHRYHVAEFADSDHVSVREIGVIEETRFTGCLPNGRWGRDLTQLLERLTLKSVSIVTLTVTEKGYFLDPERGELLLNHKDIVADLECPDRPRTAPGILVEALARRRHLGIPPFTVLSCDNMSDNGARTRRAVLTLAARRDPELAAWIEREVAFPSSMVDRIVPAMTDGEFERLSALGLNDPHAVISEAFSQWVVEDHFPLGRPDWEADGVQMVQDVAPFETMKLRMLNGSHSLLAYLGVLADVETVADAVAYPAFSDLLSRYMLTEAAPTLAMPEGFDPEDYSDRLLQRFANKSLRHRLLQIAADGSQKLPQRWLQGAVKQLEQGQSIPCTALGVAAWICFQSGCSLGDAEFHVDDPMAVELAHLYRTHADSRSRVEAFLRLEAIFPPTLAHHRAFMDAVSDACDSLQTQGVLGTLEQLSHRT